MDTQLNVKPFPGTSPATRKHSMASFSPAGLHVLVVDDDPLCLMVLERMLKQCSYKVTTCNRVNRALQLLRENKDEFDLVLSDVYMPDEDGFKLLEVIGLELDLPVIMMSANGETNVVMQGITHGACDYLIKPIRIEELRNIWQHVIRHNKCKEAQKYNMQGEVDDLPNEQDSLDLICKKRKEALELEDCNMNMENSLKKARVNWSVELHRQFVDAVNKLGVDKAVPKRILEIMNVHGLTRENVASHLQKYRLYLKRLNGVALEPCPIASFQALGDGKVGGTMMVQAARKAPLPSIGVKGRNLGAGIGCGPGKDKKIDMGTFESLSKYRLHQQKLSANRAQVLGGLGLSDACPSQVSASGGAGGGLQRMCSLDLSFLLQSQSIECLTEQRSDAVDDLAACSFRSAKLEDGIESTVSGLKNKRTFASRRPSAKTDHIDQWSVANDEKKFKKVEAAAGSSVTGVFSDTQNFELGGFNVAKDSMQQFVKETSFKVGLTNDFGDKGALGCDKSSRGRNVRYTVPTANNITVPPLSKAPVGNKEPSDFTTVQFEQGVGCFFGPCDPATQSDTLADLGDLIDDALSSTNVELSMTSSTTDVSADAFSESSFNALAPLSGMISPPTYTSSYSPPSAGLDISDYLHLDDGLGFQYN